LFLLSITQTFTDRLRSVVPRRIQITRVPGSARRPPAVPRMPALHRPCVRGTLGPGSGQRRAPAFRRQSQRAACTAVRPDRAETAAHGARPTRCAAVARRAALAHVRGCVRPAAAPDAPGVRGAERSGAGKQNGRLQNGRSAAGEARSAAAAFADAPARPDAYAAQAALAPESVRVRDLGAEPQRDAPAERVPLRDLADADGARPAPPPPAALPPGRRDGAALPQTGRASSCPTCRRACCGRRSPSCR
jgi:hypothetical protein